ncbi:MAG: EF-hand domain-containing protein [Methylobacter sp.]
MSINSISGGSSAMMRAMQRPDPSKMAEDLFSKLDTKGQGYIEKSDLEAALSKTSQSDGSTTSSSSSVADALFSKLDGNGDGKVTKDEMSATIQKIASELDGPAPRMRMQGGMPPPPPPQGGQGPEGTQGTNSTNASSSSQSNDPADTNGDGTVSATEALAYALSQATSDAGSSSSSTSSADGQLMQMLAGNMQPPHNDGPGFTKDQLTSMSQQLSSTDGKKSQVIGDIVSNFDAADSDGDGKVSGSEAKAFEKSKNDSASSASTVSDAQFMKQMMQLLHSYGSVGQSAENSSFSASV